MQHLLPKELRSFRYYEKKLPLYLRNDGCFIEHFKIWYELCMGKGVEPDTAISEFCGIAPSADLLLHLLNIYDADFLETVSMLQGYDGKFDLLDNLGQLFGLNRQFSFDYKEQPSDTTYKNVQVELTDAEYLLLIKAQIIRNYCNGSYAQVREYYRDAGLDILPVNNSSYDATVDVYLNEDERITTTMTRLFKAGLLTITHVGVHYQHYVTDLLSILIWGEQQAVEGSNNVWDKGRWSA